MSQETFALIIAIAAVVSCVALLVQVFSLFGVYRSIKVVRDKVTDLAERAEPILTDARKLLTENKPKIDEITDKALEVVRLAREQATRLDAVLVETTDIFKAQVMRLDGVIDETVGKVQQTTDAVQNTVLRPIKEVSGIVAGLKAALAVFAQGQRSSVDQATQDEEMFI